MGPGQPLIALTALIAPPAMLTGIAELGAWVLGRRSRYRVTGRSMEPALHDGEQVLAKVGQPTSPSELLPGDVVVATAPGVETWVIKRVGEVLADGRVVVVSDNPAAGTDSRQWGPLPMSSIHGRVTIVLDRPFAQW